MLYDEESNVLEKTHFTEPTLEPKRQPIKFAPLHILLVEDVASDALLTRLALDATDIPYTLRTLQKGNGSIALSSRLPHARTYCPTGPHYVGFWATLQRWV